MLRQVTIRASEVHRAFGKLLKRIYTTDEHLIVERDGFPVAVLLSYHEYEKLSQERAIAAFHQFSSAFGREVEHMGISEDAMLAAIKEAKEEIYQERYGRGA